tara:strand:+ start:855 stop:1508 length:654 start_codon:yes stop_codon:yes gene_type:complete
MLRLKQKYFIDSHKGITPLFIIFLISFYNAWNNTEAIIYLALHGTYGFLWVTKSFIYPDKQWESKVNILYGFLIWIVLSLYWLSAYVIITGNHFMKMKIFENCGPGYLGVLISFYIIGVFLHFTSDMQKYISLKLNPGKLITEELFARSRNTNYLGELFIYLGFILIAKDFLPLIALFIVIVFVWVPNMINKDKSLSRYSNFSEYKRKAKMFFPFLF